MNFQEVNRYFGDVWNLQEMTAFCRTLEDRKLARGKPSQQLFTKTESHQFMFAANMVRLLHTRAGTTDSIPEYLQWPHHDWDTPEEIFGEYVHKFRLYLWWLDWREIFPTMQYRWKLKRGTTDLGSEINLLKYYFTLQEIQCWMHYHGFDGSDIPEEYKYADWYGFLSATVDQE